MEERRKNLQGPLAPWSVISSAKTPASLPPPALSHLTSRRAAFKNGDVRFLICTDVAARGIDVKELPYVVNMTLPDRRGSVTAREYPFARRARVRKSLAATALRHSHSWGAAADLLEHPENCFIDTQVRGLHPSNRQSRARGGHGARDLPRGASLQDRLP